MNFGFLFLIFFVSIVVIIQCLIELDSSDINFQGKQDKKTIVQKNYVLIILLNQKSVNLGKKKKK